jgi:hypothetical protein
MDSAIFDELQQRLTTEGPAAAIDRLCALLRERKNYQGLFYALLLKKRHELGVSPLPTGPSQDLPEAVHAPYEDAIREAARLVGRLYLDEGNIPQAYAYFRMIGEPAPVAEALDKLRPGEVEEIQPLVEIAYYHGVNPRKGFDLILERFGICNAITTVSNTEIPVPDDVREYCLKRLVRALYGELVERLKADIAGKEGTAPVSGSLRELMAGRDWLFEGDAYHIDLSHLEAVGQMSMSLQPGEELDLACELCEYGKHLSPRFWSGRGDPPFEGHFRDYAVYLAVLAGDEVEQGLACFRAKVENADAEEDRIRPAEVLVNLLLRLGRPAEALAVARRHLAGVDSRQLICPSITELCQRANDYRTLAEVAREQADPVHFMAGLLAGRQTGGPKPLTAGGV